MKSQNNFVSRILVFVVIFFTAVIVAATIFDAGASERPEVRVSRAAAGYRIEADGFGVIRETPNAVSGAEVIRASDPNAAVFIWNEQGPTKEALTFYSISLDGKTVSPATQARYKILLRYAEFDPLRSVPSVPENLASR